MPRLAVAVLTGLPLAVWPLTAVQVLPSAVAGEVVDAQTGAAIAGARVSLAEPLGTASTALTGETGQFAFDAVSPGRYELGVSASGFASGGLGVLPGSGGFIDIADGQPSLGHRLYLWKLGVISGTVVDQYGQPAVSLAVEALRRDETAGRVSWFGNYRAVTDDKGRYRLSSLPPARYVVAVQSAPAPALRSPGTGVPTVFYPAAATTTAAELLAVGPGEERRNTDISLGAPVALGAVAGRVTTPEGPVSCKVRLVPWEARDSPSEIETLVATSSPDGRFGFVGVPPGQYELVAVVVPTASDGTWDGTVSGPGVIQFRGSGPHALPPTPSAPTWWGEASLTVEDRGTSDVTLALQAGARIFGRVTYDGTASRPDPVNAFVIVTPADARDDLGDAHIPLAPLGADGVFETVGLPPGFYEVSPFTLFSPRWSVDSVLVGGKDIAGGALELGSSDVRSVQITLTDRPASLSGTTRDRNGVPIPGLLVVAFARDPQLRHHVHWGASRMAMGQSDAQGRYALSGLLPGDYYVGTLSHEQLLTWVLSDQSEQLNQLAGTSAVVRLDPHESHALDLQVRNPSGH